jgi:acyl-CoA synthetase (AMP-forming)/AMP-acid ligase II
MCRDFYFPNTSKQFDLKCGGFQHIRCLSFVTVLLNLRQGFRNFVTGNSQFLHIGCQEVPKIFVFADGHFFFVGRSDDIITSAGYRIGPFDVESVVMEHPAVAEAAVVGKPDPERTEIVKAFVVPTQRPAGLGRAY